MNLTELPLVLVLTFLGIVATAFAPNQAHFRQDWFCRHLDQCYGYPWLERLLTLLDEIDQVQDQIALRGKVLNILTLKHPV